MSSLNGEFNEDGKEKLECVFVYEWDQVRLTSARV